MNWKEKLFGKNSGLLNPMSSSLFGRVIIAFVLGIALKRIIEGIL